MKRFSTISTILALVLLMSLQVFAQNSESNGWREGEKQIRINDVAPETVKQLYALKLNMDFYGPAHDHITAYVIPSEIERIEAMHIPYTVEIENLNEYYKDFWNREDAYHSYQGIIDLADSLATFFPAICKKYVFGYSVQNRQCAALKISDNVDVDENEAEVMFDGGIHGDEIGGPENIIRFARDLCINYGTDPVITNLIDNREIWLYLMDNPDGRYNMSRYNANGVDLNRDWGYMWDQWGGSPGAFSQVESRALRECMYNNQFVVHTSYHSGTEIISYPWSYRPNATPDQSHINQLAGVYSSVSGYSYLEYGQGYNVMYAINGSTKDGNYGMMGSISWSIEISYSKQPPASQIMMYYNYNYPSMLTMIEYAGYGLEGTVTDAVTGNPVPAVVLVNNYYPTYTDSTAGDYHKYVLPGTYSITVIANGYQSQTTNNVVVTSNNSTNTDFQLIQQPGHYVYRFSASQIPDNNFSDEGLTPAVIGPPDGVNYSIGKGGWCVMDMQYPVANLNGADIVVHEGDSSPEGYYCYVGTSIDGPWFFLGIGTGTTQFDISSSGLEAARFIKILDDGDGVANAPDAGFDLDAIEGLDIIPVELSSFTAGVTGNNVNLKWTTATEINNKGFEIQRSENNWIIIGFVEGNGTSTESHSYSFNDENVQPGEYQYRLKQIDFDGSFEYLPAGQAGSEIVEIKIPTPQTYSLEQNYPNPFNPTTSIEYSIPSSEFVTLRIYDLLGQEVSTLVNENKQAGNYKVEFDASSLSGGVYLYKLTAGSFTLSRKLILLK
jgi:hypothetical protein